MAKRRYFAYGSNMDEAQMAFRCPGSTSLGVARLENHNFIINDRGVASIVETKGKLVYGLLWDISENDERNLDRFEGVAKGLYRKLTISVAAQDNQTVDAVVYVASSNEGGKPRPEYMERIVRAARSLSFPTECIEELKTWLMTEAQNT